MYKHRLAGTWLAVPLGRWRKHTEIVIQILGCYIAPSFMRRSSVVQTPTSRSLRGCIATTDFVNLTDAENIDSVFGVSLEKVAKTLQADPHYTPPDPWPSPKWLGLPSIAVLGLMAPRPYLDDQGNFRKPELMTSTGFGDTRIKQYTMPGMTWEGYQRYYRHAVTAWHIIAKHRSSDEGR